jgi:energy-coupling factor transporter ATP-binding protein EcfA2
MFRKVAIRNFKSLANAGTELGPFTVLVGDNGAGKSSFLQAIELASWAVKYDSINDALLRHHVDFRDLVYLRAPHSKISLEFELEVRTSESSDRAERVGVDMTLAKKRYVYTDVEFIAPATGPIDKKSRNYGVYSEKRSRMAFEKPNGRIVHENVALGHSMLRDVYFSHLESHHFPVLFQVANHFLEYVHYEIWGPENLRNPSRGSQRPRGNGAPAGSLGKRGEGLPRLLWRIREEPERWQRLMAELQDSYPGIKGIHFRRGLEARELGLLFVEQPASSRSALSYRPSQMSDGFLRLLALLAIKYQPAPLALLGYEEPENGLHPRALDDCVRHLKGIVRNGTQVIVTTHSPYLLNHLLEDDAEPKAELRLVLRDRQGRTTITAPDPGKLERARRQGFGVGELWGMLLNEKELAQP